MSYKFQFYHGIIIFVMLMSVFLLCGCTMQKKDIVRPANGKRISVTFIMGVDRNKGNDFYTQATKYFRSNPAGKTDFIIQDVATLSDVIDWLQKGTPHKQMYSDINIVSHGNPWQGMSVPVASGYYRCSYSTLQHAITNRKIKPLSSVFADSLTTIKIISCAVGRDKDFGKALSALFTGAYNPKNKPLISVPTSYLTFTEDNKMTEAAYYFITSKHRYDDNRVISARLMKKYGDLGFDWTKAYSTRRLSDKYPSRHSFRMAVVWQFVYDSESEIPVLKDEKSILGYLNKQQECISELKSMELLPGEFQWFSFPLNQDQKGIKILGYCEVNGVLEPLCI